MTKNKFFLNILTLVCGHFYINADESISSKDKLYREICIKALENAYYFENFRHIEDYSNIVEMSGGGNFATYILRNASKETLSNLKAFQRLEDIGSPITTNFRELGNFSGTTLRYIVIADQIKKIFVLPFNAKIVEIGAGFGGQSYILNQIQPFSKYYIYDLPEVEALIKKVATVLSIPNIIYMPLSESLPEERVDLVISNYAFSECSKTTQLDYIDKVIRKSQAGYMIYNQIGKLFGVDSLSPEEFVSILKSYNIMAKIYSETIQTFANNVVIVWGANQALS